MHIHLRKYLITAVQFTCSRSEALGIGFGVFKGGSSYSNYKQLLQKGREKRVEFTRGMSTQQVKTTLLQSFPKLRLQNATLLKCNSSKRPSAVKNFDGFSCGEDILQISSKESLYLVEEPEPVSVLYGFVYCLLTLRGQIAKIGHF